MPRTAMIRPRRGTRAEWATAEVGGPALAPGEIALVDGSFVLGDGVKKVADLAPAGSKLRKGTAAEWAAADAAASPGVAVAAGETVQVGDATNGYSSVTGDGTRAVAALPRDGSGTYAPKATVAGLSEFPLGFHRSGGNVFPEQTLETGDLSAALPNVEILDWDAGLLSDGAIALMHDDTVTRTTTSTGNLSSLTSAGFKALVVDADQWFAPAWTRGLHVPLLSEVLDRFGGRKVLSIEPKSTSVTAPLIAAIVARGHQSSCIINSQILSDIAAAKAAGIAAHYHFPTADVSGLATAVAAAPDALWISPFTTTVDAQTVVASGIPVWVYSLTRQYDYNRFKGAGVVGFVADEPLYATNTHTRAWSDSWATKTYGHGMVDSLGVRPLFAGARELRFNGSNIQYLVQGSMQPVTEATYQIDVDLGWSTLPTDTTRYLSVLFCAETDQVWHPNIGNVINGYHVVLRANGQFGLYKRINGSSESQLGTTQTTAALVAGTYAHLQINVTPSAITVTRTDSAGTVTNGDTSYRGGYFHFGKVISSDGNAMFRALAMS